jgi:hypothetical protein
MMLSETFCRPWLPCVVRAAAWNPTRRIYKELTMKGKPEVLKVLQEALTDELGAVHSYILHAEMCENWG